RVVLPFLDVLLELFAHLLHARLQLFMHLLEALAHLLHGFAHFFGQLGGYFIFTPAADADSYAVFLDVFPVALFVRFLGLLAQALDQLAYFGGQHLVQFFGFVGLFLSFAFLYFLNDGGAVLLDNPHLTAVGQCLDFLGQQRRRNEQRQQGGNDG